MERGDRHRVGAVGAIVEQDGAQPAAEPLGPGGRVQGEQLLGEPRHLLVGHEAATGVGLDRVGGGPRARVVRIVGERGPLAADARLEVGDRGGERLVEAAERGEQVAHVGIVEQAAGPADAVGDAGPAERELEHRGLGVGADQHGLGGPRAPGPVVVAHGAGDPVGLVGVGPEPDDDGHRPVLAVRPQRGAPPASGEDRGGDREDLGRRAVRVAQLDHLGARVVLGEAGEEPGVGAVPAVDRLVGVADHAQVGPVAQPGPQEALLERVDVLVLVDEQVAEAPVLGGGDGGVALDPLGAALEQVIEVDDAAAPLVVLVALVPVGDALGVDGRRSAGALHGVRVAPRRHHASTRPLDLGGEVRGRDPAGVAEDPPEDAALAVEEGGRRGAVGRPRRAQLGVGEAVEGARRGQVAQAEGAEAGVELAGGLAGEGDREHVAGVGVAGEAAVRDPAGEHPGLARAGAGEDGERVGRAGDGGALVRVEAVEELLRVHPARLGPGPIPRARPGAAVESARGLSP